MHVRRDGGVLARELQGRVLIILNTRYALDASRYKQIAQDDLLLEEIYAAARGSNGSPGIHTLIVGDPQQLLWDPFACHGLRATNGVTYSAHPPPPRGASDEGRASRARSSRQGLLEGINSDGEPGEFISLQATFRAPLSVAPVIRRYTAGCSCGPRNPRPADLATVAAAAASNLARAHPAEQRLVVHRFSPATEPLERGCFSSTASIGALRVYRGLSATVPKVRDFSCSPDFRAFMTVPCATRSATRALLLSARTRNTRSPLRACFPCRASSNTLRARPQRRRAMQPRTRRSLSCSARSLPTSPTSSTPGEESRGAAPSHARASSARTASYLCARLPLAWTSERCLRRSGALARSSGSAREFR